MTHEMVTTAFTLDGFRIVKSMGVVRGIVVRSRSIFGTIGAGLQTIVGGNITLLTELCEKTRSQAFELMLAHASQIGANGIVGTRYDATEVMGGVTEVLCYGTAVFVETPSKEPVVATARPIATSPSGCAPSCCAIGATRTGVRTAVPRTVVATDTEPTSWSTCGRNRIADQSTVPSPSPTPDPAAAA